ncbi:uncharacterized protein LOC116930784 [Daphnia magna]|uniref:uncharacterized protein LOC116930784 n=1 Tax=Daphnia magna TaxID=35525 RepID=UPI001E1BD50D|nr:uncharacterized protein LOC116930784 [Daphnia magna]
MSNFSVMMACPVSVMVGVPCVSVMIGVPYVSVMIGVPCVNTICFIYSCAVISTPALVRGDSQAARKVGSSSSARSLTKESTGRLLGIWRKLCDDTGKIPFLGPVNR